MRYDIDSLYVYKYFILLDMNKLKVPTLKYCNQQGKTYEKKKYKANITSEIVFN
jgi:hypothetical protein